MAKKSLNLAGQSFGIFAVVLLMAGAFLLGNKVNILPSASTPTVLGASTSTTKAGQVASAAYNKCISNGGFVTTSRRGSNGYYNVCNFADDMNCDLYSLYDGQCPVGGVHTIGYNTTAQVYCALRGGHPQGNENGQCKMPDGKVCTTSAVYNGTCEPN
ncbi:MAG TPA: hypothetical protein VHE53_04265 [Patescibacteria group bacterium]|nr:hypothetical protein [Patescibacteria group bacterium]